MWTWRCRLGLTIAIVCVLFAGPAAGTRTYTSEPIYARLVDRETGNPIKDALVVASWEAQTGMEGGNFAGFVMVMETRTDADGWFRFEGWGPRTWGGRGIIRWAAPKFTFLAAGYAPATMGQPGVEDAPARMVSRWNGRDLPLQRAPEDVNQLGRLYMSVGRLIDYLLTERGCWWRSTPFLLRHSAQMHEHLTKSGVRLNPLSSYPDMQREASKECGSVRGALGVTK